MSDDVPARVPNDLLVWLSGIQQRGRQRYQAPARASLSSLCRSCLPLCITSFHVLQASKELFAVLTELGLMFKLGVRVRSYLVHAVVEPQISTARPIILLLGFSEQFDCFANEPTRWSHSSFCMRRLVGCSGVAPVVKPRAETLLAF